MLEKIEAKQLGRHLQCVLDGCGEESLHLVERIHTNIRHGQICGVNLALLSALTPQSKLPHYFLR